MLGRSRLVAQQIAVGTGIEQGLIALAATLAERKGYGTIGVFLAHRADDAAHTLVVKPAVFPTLHNEGAEAQRIAFVAAFQYLLVGQAVTHCRLIAAPQAAIKTVVLTVARQFDETTHKNLVAIGNCSHLARCTPQGLDALLVLGAEDKLQLLTAYVTRVANLLNDVHSSLTVIIFLRTADLRQGDRTYRRLNSVICGRPHTGCRTDQRRRQTRASTC